MWRASEELIKEAFNAIRERRGTWITCADDVCPPGFTPEQWRQWQKYALGQEVPTDACLIKEIRDAHHTVEKERPYGTIARWLWSNPSGIFFDDYDYWCQLIEESMDVGL